MRTGGADVDHIRAAGARVLAEHAQEIGTLRAHKPRVKKPSSLRCNGPA